MDDVFLRLEIMIWIVLCVVLLLFLRSLSRNFLRCARHPTPPSFTAAAGTHKR